MKNLSMIFVMWLILAGSAVTRADEPITSADQVILDRVKIGMLEKENRELKAELILIKAQLESLRGKSATTPATAPADEGPKTYHHVIEFLRELPPELKPKPPILWDETQMAKVPAWLKQVTPGKPFAATVRIASVKVEPNPAREKDISQPKWVASILFYPEKQTFFGTHIEQVLEGVNGTALGVTGDQELLHRFDHIRGAHIDITGEIDEITVDFLNINEGHVTLHLRNYKLNLPQVPGNPPSPANLAVPTNVPPTGNNAETTWGTSSGNPPAPARAPTPTPAPGINPAANTPGVPSAQQLSAQADAELKAYVAENPNVQSIKLKNRITDAGLKELEELKNLQELTIQTNTISDAGMKELQNFKNLQVLGIINAEMTDAGLKEIAKIEGLKGLGLASDKMTDSGLQELTQLKNLQSLSIYSDKLTEASLKELKQFQALRVLNFGFNLVTDANIKELQDIQNLQEIHIGSDKVTDGGLEELKKCKNLQTVTITSPQITDAGLKTLIGMSSLKSVMFGSEKITDAGVADFKAAMPGVTVVYALELERELQRSYKAMVPKGP